MKWLLFLFLGHVCWHTDMCVGTHTCVLAHRHVSHLSLVSLADVSHSSLGATTQWHGDKFVARHLQLFTSWSCPFSLSPSPSSHTPPPQRETSLTHTLFRILCLTRARGRQDVLLDSMSCSIKSAPSRLPLHSEEGNREERKSNGESERGGRGNRASERASERESERMSEKDGE